MSNVIDRLRVVTGEEYLLTKPWPGAPAEEDAKKQLRVAAVFFRTESKEGYDYKDPDGDLARKDWSTPAHYEMWRINDDVFEEFGKQMYGKGDMDMLRAAAARNPEILQRIIYLNGGRKSVV